MGYGLQGSWWGQRVVGAGVFEEAKNVGGSSQRARCLRLRA